MPGDPIDKVLAALGDARASGGQWSARCPAHEDARASLSVAVGKDARVLLHCHAGCTPEAICTAAGLTYPGDLFVKGNGSGTLDDRIVATYDYAVGGDCLVQKVRLFPKDFRLRHRLGDAPWAWNAKGIEVPLYNDWTVDVARSSGRPVYVVEGEKDADAMWDRGHAAVTNIGGAGKWRAAYSGALRGVTELVIIADRDAPGRAHAWQVYDSVSHVVPTVSVVESDRGKDAAEHFELGGTLADFLMAERPVEPTEGEPEATPTVTILPGSLASDLEPRRVSWLWDRYIPVGKFTLLDGDPGVAKSTLAIDLAARVSTGSPFPHTGSDRVEPAGVVMLTAEDSPGDTVVPRLIAAGADRALVRIIETITHTDEEGRSYEGPPTIPGDLDHIEAAIRAMGARLLIIDVLVAFLGAVNTWRDGDVRRALLPLTQMADRNRCAVLGLRHLSKGSLGGPALYRGGGSIGITGAARVALMAAPDPSDETGKRRVLAVAKNNLAATPTSLTYETINDPMWGCGRIAWGSISNLTADDLGWKPKAQRTAGTYEEVGDWLTAVLTGEGGEMPFADLLKLARLEGFAERSLREAGTKTGVVIERRGRGREHRSVWRLPVEKRGDY